MSLLHSATGGDSTSRQQQQQQQQQKQRSQLLQQHLRECCPSVTDKFSKNSVTTNFNHIDNICASESSSNVNGVEHHSYPQHQQHHKYRQHRQRQQHIRPAESSILALRSSERMFNEGYSSSKTAISKDQVVGLHHERTSELLSDNGSRSMEDRLSAGKDFLQQHYFHHCSHHHKTMLKTDDNKDEIAEPNNNNTNNNNNVNKNTKDCLESTNASNTADDPAYRRLHYRFSRGAILTATYNILQAEKSKAKRPLPKDKTTPKALSSPIKDISNKRSVATLQENNSDSGIVLDQDNLNDSECCNSNSSSSSSSNGNGSGGDINKSIVITDYSSEESSAISTPSASTASSPLSTPTRLKPQTRNNDLSHEDNLYLQHHLHHHNHYPHHYNNNKQQQQHYHQQQQQQQQHILQELKNHNYHSRSQVCGIDRDSNKSRSLSPPAVSAMYKTVSASSNKCRPTSVIVPGNESASVSRINNIISGSDNNIVATNISEISERIPSSASLTLEQDASQSMKTPEGTALPSSPIPIPLPLPSSATPTLPSSTVSSLEPVTGATVEISQKNIKKFDPRLGPSPYRQLLPIALCILSFATVFSVLIVYMDTTEIRHQQFRINMSRDYEMFGVAQDDPQLIAFIREIHMPKYSMHFTKGPLVEDIVVDSINERNLGPGAIPDSGSGQHRNIPSASIHLNLSNAHPKEMMPKMAYYVANLLKGKTNGAFIQSLTGPLGQLLIAPWLTETLNWAGLVVEPEPRCYFTLRKQNALRPRLQVMHACVSPNPYPKEVTIPNKESDVRINSLLDEETSWFNSRVKCFPLYSVMLASNRVEYDLLSLGVQGQELQILQTLPFEKVKIEIISIHLREELDNASNYITAITKFLQSKSYKLQKRFGHNYFYQRFNYNMQQQQKISTTTSTPTSSLSLSSLSTITSRTTNSTILKKTISKDLRDKITKK